MTALTRWDSLKNWDPFKEMREVQDRLSSLFSLSPFRRSDSKEETMTVAEWTPLVDITEDEKEYLIKAELPEVRKEDAR